jgi:hypothetical protein
MVTLQRIGHVFGARGKSVAKSRTIFCSAAALALTGAAPALPDLRMDTPTTVSGIVSVCTGVGDTAEHDPRWNTYPLKVVIAGKGGQYLGDADVTVISGNKPVVAVHCGGPWVLFQLMPGKYRVIGAMGDVKAETRAIVTAKKSRRVVLRFPDAGGAVSAQHVPAQN